MCRMRGIISRYEEGLALNHLHDIHRGGCGVPACLSAPASGARLISQGEAPPSPQPPPAPSLRSPSPSEWTRLLDGSETVARRVEVVGAGAVAYVGTTDGQPTDPARPRAAPNEGQLRRQTLPYVGN